MNGILLANYPHPSVSIYLFEMNECPRISFTMHFYISFIGARTAHVNSGAHSTHTPQYLSSGQTFIYEQLVLKW